jgi:hypothetical protein
LAGFFVSSLYQRYSNRCTFKSTCAFLKQQVHCIKCVVCFHDTKRRPKGLLFRITDVEQDTGREPERAGALGESPVDSRVATGSSRLREAARNGRFAQRICVSPVSSARHEKEHESAPFLFRRQQQYAIIQLSSK